MYLSWRHPVSYTSYAHLETSRKTLGILAFIKYSLMSVLRRGNRSLHALIGIVIAISLISGSWIAIDSSVLGLTRAVFEEVPVDFIGRDIQFSTGDPDDAVIETSAAVEAIESVDGILEATPFISVRSPSYLNGSGGVYTDERGTNFSGTAVFLSNGSRQLLDAFKIDGCLPGAGTVAIPRAVADCLGLGIGDNITCSFVQIRYFAIPNKVDGKIVYVTYARTTYVNVTSVISSIWTQRGFENPHRYWFGSPIVDKSESDVWLRLCVNPVVFNIADYCALGFNKSGFDFPYSIEWSYLIWVDRGDVIKPANLAASIDRLSYIQNQLAKRVFYLGITVPDSELVSPLESFGSELEGRKPLFLALSLPVLALGVYLSMIGVDLGVSERRRETAILKSRGASDRQVLESLLLEAVVLGAISGIAGLLLGVVISRFMLDAGTALGAEALAGLADVLVSPATVGLCIVVGVTLMLLSSFAPFKRISETSVTEALREYTPVSTRLDYWARTDIVILALCLLSVVTMSLGLDWPASQDFSWIVELLVTSVFLLGIAIFPALPFMLSLSVVRLLTRGSTRLYSKFTWLVKPWTRDLHHLVNRNIVRNPRRASNLCLMISLALAFGLFISVTMESTVRYEREKVLFEVGADVKLDATAQTGPEEPAAGASVFEGIVSLAGVEHAARFSQLMMVFESNRESYRASTAVIDWSDYLQTVDPSDFFFVDGGAELLEELSYNGSVLLTREFADKGDLLVGDVLPVYAKYEVESAGRVDYVYFRYQVVVAGFVKGLPGLGGMDAFIDLRSLSFIPEEDFVRLCPHEGVLIDVAPGADPHDVAAEAVGLYEGGGFACTSTVLKDRFEEMSEDTSYTSLVGFLRVEYALSIAIMTVGVGLLVFVTVQDRERELASIMARGASGGQVRRVLMGESVSLMALGLVVGTSIGVLTAYLFNAISGREVYTVVERRLAFTYVSLSIVLSSVAALLVAALIASARAGRIKLAEVLRARGG